MDVGEAGMSGPMQAEPGPPGESREPGIAVKAWWLVSGLFVALAVLVAVMLTLHLALRASEAVALAAGAAAGIGSSVGLIYLCRRLFRSGRRVAALGLPPIACTGLVVLFPFVIRELRIDDGESAPIGALRTLTTAQALYREGDKDRNGVLDYAPSLERLGEVGLVDGVLARGTKQGYVYAIVQADAFAWSCTASPARPERGDRSFFVDESGVIRFSTTGRATSLDTAIGG